MEYCKYIPGPPLSDFVELLWFHQGQDQPHSKERVLPNGSMELVINLHEDRFRLYDNDSQRLVESIPGALISGAHSEYVVIDTPNRTSLLGAHFKPGGGFAFLNMPAGELHNTSVALDLLWGRWASELRERLLEEPTIAGRFHIFERALIAQAMRATRPLERHPAVAFALKQFQLPTVAVGDITDRIGLSRRRFIQVFNEEVGLTPKLFCRIRRFQDALGLIHGGEPVAWTDVALSCGYFDQAHFIHDFRAFSGINPTSYAANKSEYPNHVPLPD